METSPVPPFRPLPLFAGRHLQTILAAIPSPFEPPTTRRLVRLPDGDQIALAISTPAAWRPEDATVVLVHGLCGCDRSPYMVRLARRLYQRGLRAVRMNLRGCGSGKGLARGLYHAGRSEDVLAVLQALRQEASSSPFVLVGYSLGGNIVLKLAGELGSEAGSLLENVIAVCPPADLLSCSRLLAAAAGRLYERQFLKLLRSDIAQRHRTFPDLPRIDLPQRLTLYQFDDLYTAPQCGFQGAEDYYRRSSSAPLVPRIAIPCRILFSRDDPVIDSTVFDPLDLPSHILVERTARGGHLGFLGVPGTAGGFRWLDSLLLRWIGAARPQELST